MIDHLAEIAKLRSQLSESRQTKTRVGPPPPPPPFRVMLSGHREVDLEATKIGLEQIITTIHPQVGICGMARGSDLLWADLLTEHGIPFEAFCTSTDQDKWFNLDEKAQFNRARERAVKVRYAGDVWKKGIEWRRNQMMISSCDLAIVIWDGRTQGGTWAVKSTLETEGRPWIHLNPITRKIRPVRCSLTSRPLKL